MLWRELWHMRGQVLAIAVVIAGGVATLVMSLISYAALDSTRDAFYRDHRFADLFVELTRAPESLRLRLEAIPGVQHVESRVLGGANLDVAGFDDPATAILLSLPDGRNSELNRLHLLNGRLPEPGRDHEVVAYDSFAEAHALQPGDRLGAVINGRQRTLEIVGIALSPEFIYHVRPGDLFPDFERHGVLWLNRSALAAAQEMEGAFNSAALTLRRGAREREVIDEIDRLLAPYGGHGAISRDDQLSHRYLELELEQLHSLAVLFPAIFLAVSAFLLNVVFSRLITTQREQIALLKAFGYSHLAVAGLYLRMVVVIVALGSLLGSLFGLWLGSLLAELYRTFFRFPAMEFGLPPQVLLIGVAVALAAGLSGAALALRRAATLPPAEAMRPEAPPNFRPTVVERLGLQRHFSQPTRMILRNIERRPLKALLTVLGIAMACGILTVGRFQDGAISHLITVQFGLSQRADLTVTFSEPRPGRVLHELEAIDGVWLAEPTRAALVTLYNGHRSYRTVVEAIPAQSRLHRLLDDQLLAVEPPDEGLLLNDFLATTLGAGPGDTITLRFMEGRRDEVAVVVAGVIREYTGAAAYTTVAQLNRWLREEMTLSGAMLAVEDGHHDAVVAQLKELPAIAGVTDRHSAIRSFYDSMVEIMLTFAFFSTLLAGSIAFGVVYNSARIALTERVRELASLRVLGLTRGEVGYILIGELALLTVLAIPVGFLVGVGLIALIVAGIESDLYRVPLIIEPSVFVFAGLLILVASALSALIVLRRVRHLDLVEVLKTRE